MTSNQRMSCCKRGIGSKFWIRLGAIHSARRKCVSTQNAGLPVGTLQYMSPEHLLGRPITAQSDIFALGLVLYELATGHHPFAGGSPFETLQSIATLKEKPPRELNPLIPPKIETLILSMLEKDAAKRPSASEIV